MGDRELTPEDYEILLRLDESVAKKDVLSAEQAAALIEHTMEEDDSCCVCMCDLESGESAVMLACGPYFHPPCIKDWLVKGKDVPDVQCEGGAARLRRGRLQPLL